MESQNKPYVPVNRHHKRILYLTAGGIAAALLLWAISFFLPSSSLNFTKEAVFSLQREDGQTVSALLVYDDKTLLVCRHLIETSENLTAVDQNGNQYAVNGVTSFDSDFVVLRMSRSSGLTPLQLYQGVLRADAQLTVLSDSMLTSVKITAIENGRFSTDTALPCGAAILTSKGELAGIVCADENCSFSSASLSSLFTGSNELIPLSALSPYVTYTPEMTNTLLTGGKYFCNYFYEYYVDMKTAAILRHEDNITVDLDTELYGKNLIATSKLLYYLSADHLISVCSLDGSSPKTLIKTPASLFMLWKDDLYFLAKDQSLYRRSLKTDENIKLRDMVLTFFLKDDSLYYVDANFSLIKRNLKTLAETEISLESFACLTLLDDHIMISGTDGQLWSISCDRMKMKKKKSLERTPSYLFGCHTTLYAGYSGLLYRYSDGRLELIKKSIVLNIYTKNNILYVNHKPI